MRDKLANQIQKGIAEGKTLLPADPFKGFRDEDQIKTTALCMRCYAPIPFEDQLCEECHKIVNIR